MIPGMWKRLRRKTMAPRRPAVYGDQWGLVLVVALAVALGAVVVVLILL